MAYGGVNENRGSKKSNGGVSGKAWRNHKPAVKTKREIINGK